MGTGLQYVVSNFAFLNNDLYTTFDYKSQQLLNKNESPHTKVKLNKRRHINHFWYMQLICAYLVLYDTLYNPQNMNLWLWPHLRSDCT